MMSVNSNARSLPVVALSVNACMLMKKKIGRRQNQILRLAGDVPNAHVNLMEIKQQPPPPLVLFRAVLFFANRPTSQPTTPITPGHA